MAKTKQGWGFDPKNLKTSIRPQDDFYHYANGGWLESNKIPKTEARWGSFIKLRFNTDKQLRDIVKNLLKMKGVVRGSGEQMIRDLYLSGTNMPLRNKLGKKPIEKLLADVRAIKSEKEFVALLGKLDKIGFSLPWHFFIDQDSKNAEKYVLHFFQGGLGMPDREYYLKDEAEFVRVREAYKVHIKKILSLIGYTSKETSAALSKIMNIETKLAKISMNKVDTRDAEKTYHKKTLAQFKKLSSVDFNLYFKEAGIPAVPYIIVAQPDFLKGVGVLFKTISISDWKMYLEWHIGNGAAPLLSNSFVKTYFGFYVKTLTGVSTMKPLWRRILGGVNATLGEAIGKIYVEKHFPEKSKKKMDELVDDLFVAYEKRIHSLDWMGKATKQKAIKKLHQMNRKIGYPKKSKSYKGLVIRADDYFGNMIRASEYEHKRTLKKLRKKIDRDEWHMYPQTVNAYCNFNLNEIVFPAAILQFPFFSFTADDAINYGGIGAVIGHEITHGFDDQGSKFDGLGNMKSWWTKEDRERFEKKSKALVEQYNSYKVADNVPVNGELTLGENIADLGGIAIAYDAYQSRLTKTGRHDIAGLSPEERFFLGAAQAECEKARDEFVKMQVLNDPHSPSEFRINGPLINIDAFHDAFKTKSGDKLFKEREKRVKIW